MTSFDLLALIREIQPQITNSHLVNVYQAAPQLLILKLRTGKGESLQLVLEAARRAHLTNVRYKTPQQPPSFCQTLRKYLRNSTLTRIYQQDLDRVVIIEFSNGPSTYKLILELLDRGNILLTDNNMAIIISNSFKAKTNRPTARGESYTFPKLRGLDPQIVDFDQFYESIKESKSDVVRSLVHFLNLPGEVAEEVCLRAGIAKEAGASMLTQDQAKTLLYETRELIKEFQQDTLQPRIIRTNGVAESVTPRVLLHYEVLKSEEFNSFSEAIETYFEEANRLLKADQNQAARARWEHIIASQTESADKLIQEAKQLREQAGRITANLNEIERTLSLLKAKKQETGNWRTALQQIQSSTLREHSWLQVSSIEPRSALASVRVSDVPVELDARKSAAANASDYYQRAKEAEGKAKRALESVAETKRKMEAENAKYKHKQVELKRILPRRFWYERYRWFRSSEGCLVVGGRDASQNETLIKRYLESKDLVVHADIHGAPFAIIKSDKPAIGEPSIDEAAQFAVCYSSAWRGGLGSANAYWVRPEQVTKNAPSGQYLGKGAFMIRGEKNLKKSMSLRLSVGFQEDEGGARLLAGPERAITTQTKVWISIIPGDVPAERFAAQLQYRLAQLTSEAVAQEVRGLDDSEFVRLLPPGGSRFERGNS